MTVFDDELTEGHELGSGLVGKAQGFYIASAVDGTSQLMAFSAVDVRIYYSTLTTNSFKDNFDYHEAKGRQHSKRANLIFQLIK